jgi:hypothetical protein
MRRLATFALVLGACAGDDGGGPPVDPDDVDGDGILNESDLCPTRQDPAQHDDDGDRIGDVCDNCPAAPNPDQADTSERRASPPQFPDGVGDACDRRQTQADDKLARFFPFADPAEANGFTGTGFTIANDQVTGTAGRWHVKRNEQGDGLSVQARITRLVWPQTDGRFELHSDGDGVSSGFTCALVHTAGAPDELVLSEVSGATTRKSLGNLAPSSTFVMTLSRAFSQLPTGTAACFLSVDGAAEQRIDITTTDDSPFGSYGLAATDAEVELASLTIFTTPFACDPPFTGPLACP